MMSVIEAGVTLGPELLTKDSLPWIEAYDISSFLILLEFVKECVEKDRKMMAITMTVTIITKCFRWK